MQSAPTKARKRKGVNIMTAKERGRLGGIALREKRGTDYLRQIASNGGYTTVERYGIPYMKAIGSAGAIKRLALHVLPVYDALDLPYVARRDAHATS